MKKIILSLLAMVFAISAYAQTGKVTFSLIDSNTKQGVLGAVVEVYPTASRTTRGITLRARTASYRCRDWPMVTTP